MEGEKKSDCYTRQYVAELLNIERTSLYRLIKAGEITPSKKIGKRYYFTKKDIQDFLERSAQ